MQTVRQLDAGNFASYLWNDGTTGRYLNATGLGVYFVSVTDNNNCKGTDTAVISKLFPLPNNILPADTAICTYSQFILTANQSFSSYLWPNGSNVANFTVTKPGLYWLTVTDKNNCKATDSINVTSKQCLTGLYVPNAFTPNSDGKNDALKALLFGNITEFKFTVYNRYGEIVFTTSNVLEGWNGNVKGVAQNTGSFTWVCIYKLANEERQVKSGSTILIR